MSGAVLLSATVFLSGCADYEKAARANCAKTKPDMTLLRDGDMTEFLTPCGLEGLADATDRVRLHYLPPRRDGTLPVSVNTNFAVSEEGGSHGRVWYLCMPVPVLPAVPPAPVSAPAPASAAPAGQPVAVKAPAPVAPAFLPPRSQQAVCRYAGSGPDRMYLTYDKNDAASHDPRNW
ncbi:hypothetical protein [Acetobacter fallax]|uniref:hypothetical protein n=1 Tax=Acetobacter fallax TaxID=1737473 RepID=UPI0018892D5A|nr:hypothetical protein [Acetobacter fallax]